MIAVKSPTLVRGQAMLLIVGLHIHDHLGILGLDYALYRYIHRALYYIPIPALFLLFGMSIGRAASGGNPTFIAGRLITYVYLYLVWSIIIFFGTDLIDPVKNRDLLQALITGKSVLWFIYAVVIYICLAHLLRALPLHSVIVFTLAVSVIIPALGPPGYFGNIAYNWMFFWLGFSFRSQVERALRYRFRSSCVAAAVYVTLLFISRWWGELEYTCCDAHS